MIKNWLKDLFVRSPGAPQAPLPSTPSTHRQVWAVAITAGLLLTLLYVFTVAPSLGMTHDTGELTTCCVIQGVPHSPGYPLFVALGWLVNQLPFGAEPAFRINVLCAVEVGLAMGFLGAGLALVTRPFPALVATLLAGTSSAIWRQAVATEVFALHLLLMSILLWLALLWERSGDNRRREIVLATSFILGCCLAHQHVIALAGPVFLLFGAFAKGRGRSWGFSWPGLVILPLTVLAFYALQMYFARQAPELNWARPTEWSSLWNHFLRKSYGTGLLNTAALEFDSRAGDAQVTTLMITLVRSYFPFPLFVFLLLGLDRLFQGKGGWSALLFCGLAFVYGPFFAVLGNQPTQEFYADLLERFYSGAMLGLAGLLALGLEWLFTLRPDWTRHQLWLSLLVVFAAVNGYPKSSQRGMYHITDLLRGSLSQIPAGSVFLVGGDLPGGAMEYLQTVLGERRDVRSILPGMLLAPWYLDRLPARYTQAALKPLNGELATSPEIACKHLVLFLSSHGKPVYSNDPIASIPGSWLRVGPIYRYLPENAPPPAPEQAIKSQQAAFDIMEKSPRRGSDRKNLQQNFWIRYCIDHWIEAYRDSARALVDSDPERACRAMTRVIEMENPATFESHLNRGRLYLKLKRFDDAIADLARCLSMDAQSQMALESMVEAHQGKGDAVGAEVYKVRLQRSLGQ